MCFEKFLKIYFNFDFQEAKSEIDFVLDILFNYKYKDFLLGKKLDINQIEQAEKIFIERVRTKRPIQQISGMAFFWGKKFFVNEFTLIPRVETEILVNEVLKYTKKSSEILDLCTGSGCIGICIKLLNENIFCDLSDISPSAIEIAKKNALYHNILEGINFIESDIFENIDKKYDIIVSNPPYIPLKDKETLQKEVKDFEPGVALFTNDDEGLEFYKKIIFQSPDYLTNHGILAFEIGINQAQKIKILLEKQGFSQIKIIKDFNSIERVIIASL